MLSFLGEHPQHPKVAIHSFSSPKQLHFAPSCLTLTPETPDVDLVESSSLLAQCEAQGCPSQLCFLHCLQPGCDVGAASEAGGETAEGEGAWAALWAAEPCSAPLSFHQFRAQNLGLAEC